MEIFKKFMFDLVYFLFYVLEDYKCCCMYGYIYIVCFFIKGDLDLELGWVVDFGDVKVIWKLIEECLDYCMFNDIFGLENFIVENLVIWIWW